MHPILADSALATKDCSMLLPRLGFDPYEAWLGIKVAQRPLNPYQLLKLAPLDGDPGRIRLAIERQRLLLASHSGGAEAELWRIIHDELEAAAAALLDPEKKAVVDAAIKRKTAAAQLRDRPADQRTVAARGAGGPIHCPSCQCENPASRRFCGGCGQGLWEKCPQCGGELPAFERFCGQCGIDIRGLAQEQVRQIQERLDVAHAFVKEHCYDAALSALRGVAAVDDPKLEGFAAQALGEIEQVESLRRQALGEASAAKTQAAEFVKQRAFDWAVKVLDKIPPPLRDEEAASLLEQARFASRELARLLAEIKEAVQQKRTWDLFPKIDRVLALKPDHAAVLTLANKLRDQFVAGARQRLAEHRYDEARQVLLQIPARLRQDDALALLDQASELAALLADLKEAPYATSQALALAQRLVKGAPTNAEVARLYRQLEERCAVRTPDPRLAVPPWARPRGRLAVGPPVDWLVHFVRAEPADDKVAQSLREHPGQLFVALGLALQGIDEAAIETSLIPPEKANVLVKLATMPLLSRAATTAWGIDLGGFALKALQLRKEASGKIKVADCQYILLKKPLGHPDAEGERLGILSEALADLASRVNFKGSRVVTALSGRRVLGRFFDLPPLPAKKVPGAVEYETRHQLPLDLDELCWDWKALGKSDDRQADQAPRPIMVVAARQAHVQERLSLFKSAGIALDVMQSDCVALHNALQFELGDQPRPADEAIALVDVGSDETNFVVSRPGSVWFRSFGLGGAAFTAALIQQLQLKYEHAEQLKRQPAKARRYHEFLSAIEPLFVQLQSEIDRSLAGCRRQAAAPEVKRLFVLGGGAHLHGLIRHVRQR
jgi:type IV pilus assembly protein PilM